MKSSFWTQAHLLTVIFIGVVIIFLYPIFHYAPHFTGTDIGSWGPDWQKFRQCKQLGFNQCVPLEISKFPLSYLLNSYLLYLLKGVDQKQGLLIINLVFLSLPIFFISLTRGFFYSFRVSNIYILVILLTAIPPFYLYSGALEFQSGVVIGIFISSCLLLLQKQGNKKWLIFFLLITSFILPTYKDTNVPLILISFILSFSLLASFSWLNKKLNIRTNPNLTFEWCNLSKKIFLIGLGLICISLALGLLYNNIKFGSIKPIHYLYEASQTSPSILNSLKFLMLTYLSPNGGIIIFWFASFFFLFLALYLFKMKPSQLGLLLSAILILLSSLGLSLWWTPFGWDSWGDRLIIPAMVSAVICILSTARLNLSAGVLGNLNGPLSFENIPNTPPSWISPRLLLVMIIPLLFSLHYTLIAYYSNREKLIEKSLFPVDQCTKMLENLRTTGSVIGQAFWRTSSYYNCANERFLFFPRYISPK